MAEQNVSPDLSQPIPTTSAAELLKGTRETEALFAAIRAALQESLPEVFNEVFDTALERTGYTEEVSGLVRLLAARSNDSKENAILKALTLYGLALDAREKGNRMAILNVDDEILHEVIGFDTFADARSHAAF